MASRLCFEITETAAITNYRRAQGWYFGRPRAIDVPLKNRYQTVCGSRPRADGSKEAVCTTTASRSSRRRSLIFLNLARTTGDTVVLYDHSA